MVGFFGCNHSQPGNVIPGNQEVVNTYEDGKPKTIKVFKEINGKNEWTGEISFHRNGVKSMEGAIVNGLREGEWISWYDNGSVWSKGSFKNGTREGHGTVYFKDGRIQIDGYYAHGERTGLWKSYDEEGKLISETDYSDSK